MTIPIRSTDPLFFNSKKNMFSTYSVLVQACLFLTLITLSFFTSARYFYFDHLFSSQNYLNAEKINCLKLDLNESALGELAQVPGIGKSIANEIISYRKANGGFNNLDEIEKIKGIGKKTAEKIRPHLLVGIFVPKTTQEAPRIWIPPGSNPNAGKTGSNGKINHVMEKIDPNLATFEELKKLPGIGDTLAKRIVDKRQEMLFRDENDMQKVSGIGKKTASKITPFLKFPLISQ